MNPLASNKTKGEWVELRFILTTLALGIRVARPYGDPPGYDFLVDAGGSLSRVQVRSSWRKNRHWYAVNTGGGLHKLPFRASALDFFVVYIVPEDAWYVIPYRLLHKLQKVAFFPHRPRSRGRWEPFRNAWHLLTAPRSAGVSPAVPRGTILGNVIPNEGVSPSRGTPTSTKPLTAVIPSQPRPRRRRPTATNPGALG